MDYYGLKVRRRRRRKVRTTNSSHGFKRYPNLFKETVIERSEQAWVSDITYIKIKDRFMYLSLITDAYSRKIMGFSLYKDLSVEGPLKAFLMAISERLYTKRKLIHHSDQGVQYCSHTYVNMLKTHGIRISMASTGSPHENALAERVNGILKQEYGLGLIIEDEQKAIKMVAHAVSSYNSRRPHMSLQGQTPDQQHSIDKWNQDLLSHLSTDNRIKIEDVNVK
jgi:transposase InsO family protein